MRRIYSGHGTRRANLYTRAMAGEFDDIARRLEQIAEELADLSIARLRDAIDQGGTELPVDDKLLQRARRAVLKAANLLDSGASGASSADW